MSRPNLTSVICAAVLLTVAVQPLSAQPAVGDEFPVLAEGALGEKISARAGPVVLGVSVDENANDHAAFLKKHAPPFAAVRDDEQKLVSAVRIPVMPVSSVIGCDGKIRAIRSGYHGAETDQALCAALNVTLAETSAP